MSTKQTGFMMLAAGCVMIVTFLIIGMTSDTASERWLFVVGGVSGLVVAISGNVLRRRDRWPDS